MKLYRYFADGHPLYLVRHYWWAYLWRPAAWFFDHQPIINAILFGQYKRLMSATLKRLVYNPNSQILQLTCVYGSLTSNILNLISPRCLHIADVSSIQLDRIRDKVLKNPRLLAVRMNAEQLAYKDNAFTAIVIFFLLHEMPLEARRNTLSECLRVISVGGVLLCTEYAPLPSKHFFYRFYLSRLLLTKFEPFLSSFWGDNLVTILRELGRPHGKSIEVVSNTMIFSRFYRVIEFKVIKA